MAKVKLSELRLRPYITYEGISLQATFCPCRPSQVPQLIYNDGIMILLLKRPVRKKKLRQCGGVDSKAGSSDLAMFGF